MRRSSRSGAGEKRAVVIGDEIKIRTQMTCTLSCDHRAVDGALGAPVAAGVQGADRRTRPDDGVIESLSRNSVIARVRTILCFGDSLTWGMIPGSDARHEFEDRWPNALAAGLNGQARVIEEGLNGRFTVYDDPASKNAGTAPRSCRCCWQVIRRSIL